MEDKGGGETGREEGGGRMEEEVREERRDLC